MFLTTVYIFFNIILALDSIHSYEVNGFCGPPERPFNSVLIPDKPLYNEGEEVSYQCNQYWNYLGKKRCIKGDWIGRQFRCGKGISNNDLNYVKVEDITDENPIVLFDNNITLTPNYKFSNSFLSSRCETKFQIRSDHKIRWTLGLEKPISLPFFKINFHFLNVSVEESLKINLSVDARVSPLRTCKHVFRSSKRLWRSGTKVEVNFECNANSEDDYNTDIKSGFDVIIIETQTSQLIEYKLIALFLAEAYSMEDQSICGEPMKPFGQVVRSMWPNINYSIECLNSMIYVSPNNPDLPDTTIHNQKCIYDMRWNGTYPECVPKVVCPVPEDQRNDLNPVFKTVRFNNVYYFNVSKWYAIEGTTVEYQCNDRQTQVLLGDAIHVCKNGQWVGMDPNCFDLMRNNPKIIHKSDDNIDDN